MRNIIHQLHSICYIFASKASHYILVRTWPLADLSLRHRELLQKWPNIRHPRTYAEKMIWLICYWRHPLKTKCADKYTVREYVTQCGEEQILIPLLAAYNQPQDIDFDSLPNKCVIKCSSGSGGNVICMDKERLDRDAAIRKLQKYMKLDYSKKFCELHYHGTVPKILCEPFLDDHTGHLPTDYKFFCISGKFFCCDYIYARNLNNSQDYAEAVFDCDWRPMIGMLKHPGAGADTIAPPPNYADMIRIAEKLSKPFPIVRVDLYNIDGKIYFGELTFTSSGGIGAGWTDKAQAIMGNLIQLPTPIK